MTQIKRNDLIKKKLGLRLKELVETQLLISWESLADMLGYTTSSTLRQAGNGETLMSVEKLAGLANIKTRNGKKRVSVDWLLTGKGPPLIDVLEGDELELAESIKSKSIASRVANAPLVLQKKIAVFLDINEVH